MLTQHIQLQTRRPNHANLAKPSGVDSASFEDDTLSSEEAQGVSYVGGKVGKKPERLVEEEERTGDDKSKRAMTCFPPLAPSLS